MATELVATDSISSGEEWVASIKCLPTEILQTIFSNLSMSQLTRARRTCKRWKKAINEILKLPPVLKLTETPTAKYTSIPFYSGDCRIIELPYILTLEERQNRLTIYKLDETSNEINFIREVFLSKTFDETHSPEFIQPPVDGVIAIEFRPRVYLFNTRDGSLREFEAPPHKIHALASETQLLVGVVVQELSNRRRMRLWDLQTQSWASELLPIEWEAAYGVAGPRIMALQRDEGTVSNIFRVYDCNTLRTPLDMWTKAVRSWRGRISDAGARTRDHWKVLYQHDLQPAKLFLVNLKTLQEVVLSDPFDAPSTCASFQVLEDFVFFLVRPRVESQNMHIRLYSLVNGRYLGSFQLTFRAWCNMHVTRNRIYIARHFPAAAVAPLPGFPLLPGTPITTGPARQELLAIEVLDEPKSPPQNGPHQQQNQRATAVEKDAPASSSSPKNFEVKRY